MKLTAKQQKFCEEYLIDGKYYVYELIDPSNNQVFYVGKGKGDRVSHHVRQCRRDSKYQSNKDKINRIKSILDMDLDVIENIIQVFDTQEEAIEFESEMISLYGIDNLTNKHYKGTVYNYKKYPFSNFVNSVKLAVSMMARIKKPPLNESEMVQDVYNGIFKEYEHICSIGGIDFMNILNQELNTKWKGAARCLN